MLLSTFLLAMPLAAVSGHFVQAKRALIPLAKQTYAVKDGSFEDVSDSLLELQGASSGNWSVSGNAVFESESNSNYTTPYGSKFVVLSSLSTATVSQTISPSLAGTYHLSYAYSVARNTASGQESCNIVALYGAQILDSVTFTQDTKASSDYVTRTATLFVLASSQPLALQMGCGGIYSGEIDVIVDNISLA